MKKMMFMLGIVVLMTGIVSCKSSSDTTNNGSVSNNVEDMHNSNNSLDWNGVYSGIIPCADCSGIQMSLDLSQDGTYTLKRQYLGKEENNFESTGKFEWVDNGNAITFGEGEDKMMFAVGENMVTVLDREGKKITGELANNYMLAKVDKGLVEKYWKLTELFGEPVTTPEGGKEAHMILSVDGNRIHGNSGCNTFNGTYELKPGNRITFSKMASTMMMCVNMDTETKMHQVFETADSYILNGDSLVLNRARMAPLARFVAVYLR